MMYSEEQIIKECKKRNPVFQRVLYDRYVREMTTVCRRYTKNDMYAKDVLQEGFIKVFESIKGFRQESSLKHWVRTIMVNTALNYIRKEFNQARFNYDLKEDVADHETYDDQFPEEKEEAFTDMEELIAGIQWLPVGYRTVLNMYAIEGFSHKEIARKLKISVGTSKSQLNKARKMLKKILSKSNEVISHETK